MKSAKRNPFFFFRRVVGLVNGHRWDQTADVVLARPGRVAVSRDRPQGHKTIREWMIMTIIMIVVIIVIVIIDIVRLLFGEKRACS